MAADVKFFETVQLWDSTKLPKRPSDLRRHVAGCRANGSLSRWTIQGEHGPHGDPDYGPEDYGEDHIRLDREVDAWLVEHGAVPGSDIVWHIWW